MVLKHCCCCFDHRRGVMALAAVLTFFSLAGLILGSVDISENRCQIEGQIEGSCTRTLMEWTRMAYNAPGYSSLVSGAVMTLFNILLFVGASKGKRAYFLPWLVVKMIMIVSAYIVAGSLLVFGILNIAFAVDIYQNKILAQGRHDDEYDMTAALNGLSGLGLVLASVLILASAALMTYFWAVVQHLYRKLGQPNSDEENLIKGPDFVKEPKGPIVFK